MSPRIRRAVPVAMALVLALALFVPRLAVADAPQLPQIDSSTARKPITNAIYELYTGRGYAGPQPICSKTHGAWLNLADGKADIIFLVAPTQEELDYFAQVGVDYETRIYGFDGLVFMGNQANPVKNLTSKEIRNIYSGKTTNWKSVKGGKDADIMVYIRNPESGSQRLFESLVWDGYEMPDFAALQFAEGDANAEVTTRTKTITVSSEMDEVTKKVLVNQYSIGFNIMSYIDSEFADSGLKLFSVDGFAPTTENFASGDYPFLTTSYVVIRADEPEGSPARQLFDWVGTQEGRKLLADNSTLTISISDSVVVRVGDRAPADNAELAATVAQLDARDLTREELYAFTPAEIEVLRGGVYALSGMKFKDQALADYFKAQSWYKGDSSDEAKVAKRFSERQKANLQLIMGYQKELRKAMGE